MEPHTLLSKGFFREGPGFLLSVLVAKHFSQGVIQPKVFEDSFSES